MKETIKELFRITRQLESEYERYGRKFTVDGHLIGSIGEVIVAEEFGLELLKNSTPYVDAVAKDHREVQIKATQIDRVSFSKGLNHRIPQHVIVIHIGSDGEWDLVYNGPGRIVYDNLGKRRSNGQAQISLNKLKELMKTVAEEEQLPLKE